MIIIGIIIGILIAIGVFFLFAIWRAILGKSSVDLRLGISVEILSKKIESLNKNFTQYTGVQDTLRKELQESARMLKDIRSGADKNS